MGWIKSLILDMFSLRYTFNIHVKIPSRQTYKSRDLRERGHIWASHLGVFSIQLVFKFRRANEITKSLRKYRKNVKDSALRPSVIKRSDRGGESSKGVGKSGQ